MKNLFSIFLKTMLFVSVLASIAGAQQATKDFTRYVNPFIGTGGHGHAFPGATVPFGAVQLSPDTRTDNWDGSSGYHYSDNTIFGFSHTHLSGTGIPDYCDILVIPRVDKNNSNIFSHANEKAGAGYYSVKMDNGILAELTATKRVGFHRYTFPEDKFVNLDFDLKWRDKVLDSYVKIVGKNSIEGFRRSSSWAKDQVVYFAAEFSESFVGSAIAVDNVITDQSERLKNAGGNNLTVMLRFDNSDKKPILVKVGISAVSVEGARKNLEAEIKDWNFERVRQEAKAAWNKELAQIEVSGGSDEQLTNFYTALYHTKIQPNIFQDVDGNYLGLDKKIHSAPKDSHYTIFSLWDTFRAAHPLYTIVDERRTVDFINTFVRQYEQGGRLPVWELAANETDCMIGYHSVSVIADAMAKGIEGFDYEKAFEAAKHSAELNHFGLESYKKRGYISTEDENESVSKTLEYAYDDFCIAQMAILLADKMISQQAKNALKNSGDPLPYNPKVLEKYKDYEKYLKRAQSYKNLFDQSTGFMRPRKNGGFVAPFKPNEVTFHFTEGNSWVYSFFVPHDIDGLTELHGGKGNFAKKLDALFSTQDKLEGREQPDITGLIGQYAHGNEPSHHIAYLYNYAGEPWKTQKLVRQINDNFYKNAPDGLIGNEDCGQMSAWFVLSSLGFYQVAPSIPNYDIGTPLFKEAKINLENGKSFTIKTKFDDSPSGVDALYPYIKSVKLNGKPHRKTFFDHSDIKNGGTLEFELTYYEVKDWFNEFSSSKIDGNFVAVPLIETANRVFNKTTDVSIKSNSSSAKILYSIDGGEPTIEYTKPFAIDKTAIVKAVALDSKGEKSFVVEAKLNRLPHDWTVKLLAKYNRQYTGGGDTGLIDGIRGTLNFASGEWQGYQAQDFVAVVDLGEETIVKKLGGGFLQNARSWIWMPTRIEFETSTDGENFVKVAELVTEIAPDDMTERTKDYAQTIAPTDARFVRVRAVNLGKIPAWHPGAGSDAFIFVDEIIIE